MIYQQRNYPIDETRVISVQALFMSVLQFCAYWLAIFIASIDTTGYGAPVGDTIFYLSTFFLVVTVCSSIYNKTIGLLDMIIVPLTLFFTIKWFFGI